MVTAVELLEVLVRYHVSTHLTQSTVLESRSHEFGPGTEIQVSPDDGTVSTESCCWQMDCLNHELKQPRKEREPHTERSLVT